MEPSPPASVVPAVPPSIALETPACEAAVLGAAARV